MLPRSRAAVILKSAATIFHCLKRDAKSSAVLLDKFPSRTRSLKSACVTKCGTAVPSSLGVGTNSDTSGLSPLAFDARNVDSSVGTTVGSPSLISGTSSKISTEAAIRSSGEYRTAGITDSTLA